MARAAVVWVVPALAACATVLGAQTPEQPYLDWAEPSFTAEEYASRRAALLGQLRDTGGSVFLSFSDAGDSHGETFRQLDDFWFLTGLEVPRSVLMLDADRGSVTVFVPPRDPRFERPPRTNDFPGRPLLGDHALWARVGLTDVRDVAGLDERLRSLAREGRTVSVNFGRPEPPPDGGPFPALDPVLHDARYLRGLGLVPANAFEAVARVRSVKSPAEIALMRRAAAMTGESIRRAAAEVTAGVDERTLEAAFEGACKRQGSQRVAFASIIKSGPNSLWPWRILASHYDRRNRAMQDGELVIFDVGCELDGYVSDVGRTFPVAGRFTAEQATTVRMTMTVSDRIIAAVRPGVTLAELQDVAESAIPVSERRYMQTGLFFGHHLGLSTGDPVVTDEPLAPGMIFTVEPWYYNHDIGLSVFIEDEVLVTDDGAELLTGALPRTPEALERWMRSTGSR